MSVFASRKMSATPSREIFICRTLCSQFIIRQLSVAVTTEPESSFICPNLTNAIYTPEYNETFSSQQSDKRFGLELQDIHLVNESSRLSTRSLKNMEIANTPERLQYLSIKMAIFQKHLAFLQVINLLLVL